MIQKTLCFIFLLHLFYSGTAPAAEHDAKNVLAIATGSTPNLDDPRISIVNRQLEAISNSCASTSSRGAGIHDKLTYAHSQLKVRQSLLVMLVDFVAIAHARCSSIDDSTLLGLYVLERNDGASHNSTVAKIIRNPKPLIAKWRSR